MPPAYPTVQVQNPRRVYQVEQPEDEDSGVYMTNNVERFFLSGDNDEKFIIIDSGSAQNLIGRHLLPTLEKRLKINEHEMKLTKTEKTFQFGGRSESKSLAKTVIPLNMGGAMIYAEKFIVDNEIPFLRVESY